MRHRQSIPEEYEVTGSRELGFKSHPSASLQYVVGGLVPPANDEQHSSPLAGLRDGLDTPVAVCDTLTAQMSIFRAGVENWKKTVQRPVKGSHVPKDAAAFAAGIKESRSVLEEAALDTAIFLKVAHDRLRECADGLTEAGYTLHLGLPGPVDEKDVAPIAGQWNAVLSELGAFDQPQDPEFAYLLARADILLDEINESLRTITRQAKWLWTNEPQIQKVTQLLQWMFDLRCELLELAPILACLETPVEIWYSSLTQQES